MKREEAFDYLSDQELEQLIALMEQEELIPAPPDLVEGILLKLQLDEDGTGEYEQNIKEVSSNVRQKAGLKGEGAPGKSPEKIIVLQKRTREERSQEFRRYCIRVITSAAAALILLFTLPALLEEVTLELRSRQAVEFVQRHSIKMLQSNPAREKVLGEKGLWDSAFGNKKIFGADSQNRMFHE